MTGWQPEPRVSRSSCRDTNSDPRRRSDTPRSEGENPSEKLGFSVCFALGLGQARFDIRHFPVQMRTEAFAHLTSSTLRETESLVSAHGMSITGGVSVLLSFPTIPL